MKWSLYIGKVSGVKIFIHWSFLFLIAGVAFMDYLGGKGMIQILISLLFILSVFICIIFHELGHALVAQHYNYITKDITLLPIGGMARMAEIPEDPKDELLVSMAGPVVNLLIAVLLYSLIHWFTDTPSFFTTFFVTGDTFLLNLYIVNLALALFNLIPAFPMDGGRIFRALLSFFIDRVKATNIAVKTGQVIAALMFFVGIFYNPLLSLISILIFLFAQTENDFVKVKSLLSNYTVRDIIQTEYSSLSPDDTISDAMRLILENDSKSFLVIENNRVVGIIEKDEILRVLNGGYPDSRIREFMNKEVIFVNPEKPLDKIYAERYFFKNSILPVIEKNLLIGIVAINTIDEFIILKSASKKSPPYIYKKMFVL